MKMDKVTRDIRGQPYRQMQEHFEIVDVAVGNRNYCFLIICIGCFLIYLTLIYKSKLTVSCSKTLSLYDPFYASSHYLLHQLPYK